MNIMNSTFSGQFVDLYKTLVPLKSDNFHSIHDQSLGKWGDKKQSGVGSENRCSRMVFVAPQRILNEKQTLYYLY